MNATKTALPSSILTKVQAKTFAFGWKEPTKPHNTFRIRATVRYDDQCGNGHNTFSITGDIHQLTPKGWEWVSGGMCHEAIARHFPELAPLLKWHLCSSDGPMHYVGNTLYHVGDRDCHGLKAGEFKPIIDRSTGNPLWQLMDVPSSNPVAGSSKPDPVTLEWRPYGRTGEGKARDFDAARSCAIWPEATDAELSVEPEELKAKLWERLPALMQEFKAAVESLGMVY